MNNMTPDEILDEIERLRKSNNILKDEKVKPLSDYEISRLPKVPTEWKWVLINDISTFITNGVHTPTGPEDTNGYGLHCLRITDIQGNADINYESLPYCLRIVESDYDKKLRKGDIYFSFTGNNLGKRYIVKEDRDDTVYAHYFVRWHPLIVNPYYVYYVAHSKVYDQFIQEHQLGSTQPNLKVTDLKRFPIPLCDLVTQNKIATFLKNIEDKISINNQINRNLFELLAAMYKHDYLEEIANHEDWSEVTMDDITSKFATGLNPRKNFVLGHGENYYVTIKNMNNNRVYLDSKCDMVDDEALIKINKRSDLQVGDLLFSGIGTIGRVHLIDEPPTNWNISESVFTMRPSEVVSSEFLYLLLLSYDMQDYAVSLASGSVQKGIRMADLKRYKLYLPSKEDMDRLTATWKPLVAQIKKHEKENDELAVLRDSLLPKLMSGELDVR